MAEKRLLMDAAAVRRTLTRLSHEIVEKNKGVDNLCLIGIKRRGEFIAKIIRDMIKRFYDVELPTSGIDIGMYRDDLISDFFVPEASLNEFGFSIDGKSVVLCDDVLNTGRTVRAAIEALFEKGRPESIKLLVFADRGGKEMPVCADFVGKNIPTSKNEFLDLLFTEIDGEDGLYISELQ